MVRLYITHHDEHIARIRTHLEFGRIDVIGSSSSSTQSLTDIAEKRPDVVLVNAVLEDMAAPDFIKRAHETGAAVLVVAFEDVTQQVQRNCIMAGASEVLPNPSVKDLETVILRVFENEQAARKIETRPTPAGPVDDDALLGGGTLEGGPALFTPEHISEQGKVVAFYAPKGGVGCTTVAINTALALAETAKGGVCLVDANLQFGDIDLALGLPADEQRTILAVVAHSASGGLVDEAALLRALQPGPLGISILTATATPESAAQVFRDHLRQMLTLLRERFRYVCVNTAVGLNEHTVGVLDSADDIVVVTVPEFSAVRNTLLFLDVCGQLQYPADKVHIVLNRAEAKAEKEVGLDEVKKALKGHDFLARLARREQAAALFPAETVDKTVERYRVEYRDLAKRLVPPSGEERARSVMGLSSSGTRQ